MGVDIAVCFSKEPISIEQIGLLIHFPKAEGEVYIVSSNSLKYTEIKYFFALWSNIEINIERICEILSIKSSKICIAWKSEHSGCGGYISFINGTTIESVQASNDEYLLLPISGVEKLFDTKIQLNEDADELFFPESLFDDEIECFLINHSNRSGQIMPTSIVNNLFEGDVNNVEPVLPFDIY